MKKAIGLGLLVAVFFAVFVLLQDYIGAKAFYVAAISTAMFAVIGPFGDYFKTAIALVIGVVVAFAGIVIMAQKLPLPPDNLVYVAMVCGVSLFLMVLISVTGMRMDAMFLGWASYFAAVYGTYVSDTTALATQALPSAVGVLVSLLVGLVMSLLVVRIAMAVNK
ncbi:DUF1097 family protein [Syntrophomonas palmitatica]|uniref:DUF1097 family protein n=1 Tax=Syntrophomonas palmitatica TaxID=402877 RepID=UPI0006CFFEF9|nr:DUF1097 family protein [Syntrophomonas palmitatica]